MIKIHNSELATQFKPDYNKRTFKFKPLFQSGSNMDGSIHDDSSPQLKLVENDDTPKVSPKIILHGKYKKKKGYGVWVKSSAYADANGLEFNN